jgi:formylglycine-generating enzyme required for sulfatase activity
MRAVFRLIIFASMVVAAAPALAGPWGGLPDAVARLQMDPGDSAAEAVIAEAEASILFEAAAGRLPAVAALHDVYASLVMRLPDSEGRIGRLDKRTAAALVSYGTAHREANFSNAAAAWTLAAGYDPTSTAISLLRRTLLPPPDPEDGAVWKAPIDGADLVFHPSSRVRVGCSEMDRRCRENEVFFRWIEVPDVWIESTEVSNNRYRRCVEVGACSPPEDGFRFNERGRGSEPVVGVTWRQARSYARWAGRRLPSEAEWERTARGKELRWRFPWGNARDTGLANVWEVSFPRRGPLAVGSFPATGWGVRDMAGNIWEWCGDRYQPGLKNLPADGSSLTSGWGRSVRGGSWRRDIDLTRVSARSWYEEAYRADDLGFRCAMSASTSISNARVLSIARLAFPIEFEPGRELYGADLSAEDRHYLERRAIAWLMLEERPADVVPLAASLFRKNPRDRAALDLFVWVEGELVDEARAGHVSAVRRLRSEYRQAMSGNPRFGRRLQDTDDRLLAALLACGNSFARNNDRNIATSCFEEGLQIAPNDVSFRRGLESLEPEPGELRTWVADGKDMAWVPGGSFRFGASEGDHRAATDELPASDFIVEGFWLDRHEVTNAEYRRCVDAGACTPPGRTDAFDDPNRASHPVLWVTWFQARDYAAWAGKRLPTEVEWERAARAGSAQRFPWGDKWNPAMGNALGTEATDYFGAAAPVGSFPANAWGFHDLIGNAAEYVQDVYHPSYGGAPRDGRPWEQETGPTAERQRVVRNGSFADSPSRQRASRRSSRKPTDASKAIGFRCAAD